MNTTTTRLLTRCTLWIGALFVATSLHAGPAEDYAKADAALASGDLPTGMSLMRKAADQNHARAQARLGDLLRAADSESEAVALYRKSAEQGDAAGEFGLGRAYADGAGVKKDTAAALEWYRKAEKQNYAPALDALARAYRTGTLGLPRDPEQAKAYDERVRALSAQATAQGAAR
ncbi:tetratricopeptide repeat protein [Ramlibacter sp. AN1133]|uniref:tetratricopeptide repeat protein n=1 Tax=Ramlibacter sp. AN1133 TaxID=3133429 RepID=UPI0030BF69AB